MTISRRRFMYLTGLSTAGMMSFARLHHGMAEPLDLPAGIQLYAVRDELSKDASGTLKALYEIGYREVELAGFGKYSPAEFHGLISDAGLRCPSAHLRLDSGADLSAVLASANALGARYAVSSILFDSFPKGNMGQGQALPALGLEGFKKTAARMNELGKAAKAAGLQYAYHNHNFEFEKMPDGSAGYDVLLNETDHELVKFEIDCGWMTLAGSSPAAYLKQYPGRFRILHVKDFRPTKSTVDLRGPGRPTGVELGHGFIDYAAIFAGAKGAGIEHIFAEQEAPYARGQMESAKESFRFLESFG